MEEQQDEDAFQTLGQIIRGTIQHTSKRFLSWCNNPLSQSQQWLILLVYYFFHLMVLSQHSILFPYQLIPNNKGHFCSLGWDSLAGMISLAAFLYVKRGSIYFRKPWRGLLQQGGENDDDDKDGSSSSSSTKSSSDKSVEKEVINDVVSAAQVLEQVPKQISLQRSSSSSSSSKPPPPPTTTPSSSSAAEGGSGGDVIEEESTAATTTDADNKKPSAEGEAIKPEEPTSDGKTSADEEAIKPEIARGNTGTPIPRKKSTVAVPTSSSLSSDSSSSPPPPTASPAPSPSSSTPVVAHTYAINQNPTTSSSREEATKSNPPTTKEEVQQEGSTSKFISTTTTTTNGGGDDDDISAGFNNLMVFLKKLINTITEFQNMALSSVDDASANSSNTTRVEKQGTDIDLSSFAKQLLQQQLLSPKMRKIQWSRLTSFVAINLLITTYFYTGRFSFFWEDTLYAMAGLGFPLSVAMHRSLCVLLGHLTWVAVGSMILRFIPRPRFFGRNNKWYRQNASSSSSSSSSGSTNNTGKQTTKDQKQQEQRRAKHSSSNWVWWVIGGYSISAWLFNASDFVNLYALPSQVLEEAIAQEGVVTQLINPENNDFLASVVGYIAPCLSAPWWEEILYRGFFFPALTLFFPVWASVLISGIVFSAHHLSLTAALPLAVLGWTWAGLYMASDNLWSTIVVHALWNSRVFLSSWLGV